MGLFSKMKNSLTGGWADVSMTLAPATRGTPVAVTINVTVRSEPIQPSRVYLKVRCLEEVEVRNVRVAGQNQAGSTNSNSVTVREHGTVHEQEIVVSTGPQLDANSSFAFDAQVELPATCPPSFRGKYCQLRWEVLAGLDMKGNDPDSGWQELVVS